MNDVMTRLSALAPRLPVDPDGLAAAHAIVSALVDDEVAGVGAVPRAWRRERRRRSRIALIAAAAVVVAGVGFVASTVLPSRVTEKVPPTLAGAFPLPAAAAGDPRCLVDPIAPSGQEDGAAGAAVASVPGAADAAYLLPGAGPTSLTAATESYPCGQAAPAAAFYAPDGSAGISLYADVLEPTFAREHKAKDVSIRGATGRIITPPAGHHFLTWVEPDGTRWLVIAQGLTVGGLVAWLDSATLSGRTVAPAVAAPGMQRAQQSSLGNTHTKRVIAWEAMYDKGSVRTGEGMDGPAPGTMDLRVSVGGTDSVAAGLSWAIPNRVVTQVNGYLAEWSSGHEGGSELDWTDDEGRTFQLFGAASLDEALELAGHLEHVTFDDPRVTALG